MVRSTSIHLNLGCGEHYADGWVNTDLHREGPKPDVVCSLLDLPFRSGIAERVYCGHVLEHVGYGDMPRAAAEIHRVLAADGVLMVVGPDINLTTAHEPLLIEGVIHGGRRWPGDEHRWTATGEQTLAFVQQAGFTARLIPIADVLSAEWPIVGHDPWQFAIEARK